MLSFIAGLLFSVASPDAVLAPCEWTPATLSGISSQVCDGTVVAKRDQLGNVVVYADYR